MKRCKVCFKQQVYANRELKYEQYKARKKPQSEAAKARLRAYAKTPAGRAVHVRNNRIYRRNHPEKYAAAKKRSAQQLREKRLLVVSARLAEERFTLPRGPIWPEGQTLGAYQLPVPLAEHTMTAD